MGFQGFAYLEGTSVVHRCHPAVKIVALLVMSIAVLAVPDWWPVALLAVGTVACMIVARIPLKSMAAPLAPVIILAMLTMGFAFAGKPDAEGALRGAILAVRMVALVAASMVVCFTTTSTDLLAGFALLLKPFRVARLPVDDIALTLSLAIRFIPVVAGEFQNVRRAQQVRGAALEGMPFSRKLRIWGMVFIAVFVGLFRHADTLSVAMDARCYGMSDRKTALPNNRHR